MVLAVLLCVPPWDFKQRGMVPVFYLQYMYDMKTSHADEMLWEIR